MNGSRKRVQQINTHTHTHTHSAKKAAHTTKIVPCKFLPTMNYELFVRVTMSYASGRFSPYFFVNSSAFFINFFLSLVYSSARSARSGCSGSGSLTRATNACSTEHISDMSHLHTVSCTAKWLITSTVHFYFCFCANGPLCGHMNISPLLNTCSTCMEQLQVQPVTSMSVCDTCSLDRATDCTHSTQP